MTKEAKPFEYDELFALCYLCAAHAVLISAEKNFKNKREAIQMIEEKVKEYIALRWNDPEKKSI